MPVIIGGAVVGRGSDGHRERRGAAARGNPWVYAEDIARPDAAGDIVRVVDGRGALLGTALWAAGARLPLRLLGRGG